jgi:cation diffusion facilitator CzcD-associated flavoprotein CzcO
MICVVGSGFGGTMTALALGRELKQRKQDETVLMLERGTWWTTPVPTVRDREVETYTLLRDQRNQPVQLWSSPRPLQGLHRPLHPLLSA